MNPNSEYHLSYHALRMLKESAKDDGCVVLESEHPIGQLLVDQELARWERNGRGETILRASREGEILMAATVQ